MNTESGKRTLQALVAAGDDGLHRVIAALLTGCAGRDPRVGTQTRKPCTESVIRALVAESHFDVCLLVLNNILYTEWEPVEVRLNSSVKLVRDLVVRHGIPVVAFYGWPDDADYPAAVLKAGAAAVLRLPFDIDSARDIIRDILSKQAQSESITPASVSILNIHEVTWI
jgi:hypothetical protein